MMRIGVFVGLFVVGGVACGGIAVVDDGQGGAAAGPGTTIAASSGRSATASSTQSSTANAVTTIASVGSGIPCTRHDDCPTLQLCSFVTGVCARSCGAGSPPCPPDESCLPCGTSSCAACSDCLAVCGTTF